MTGPQIEHGYTRIANEILENVARSKLSPIQHRLILLIWRYTYGFQRKSHLFSLSFFSEATGYDKRQIQRELKKLTDRSIIFQNIKHGTSREIQFNKKAEEWTTIGSSTNSHQNTIGNSTNSTIGNSTNSTIGNSTNQERKKEKSKDILESGGKNNGKIDDVWSHYSLKVKTLGYERKKTKKKLSHINARIDDGFTPEQLKQVIDNVFASDFMLGNNEHGKPYIEIDHFMRNIEKVEKWLITKKPRAPTLRKL